MIFISQKEKAKQGSFALGLNDVQILRNAEEAVSYGAIINLDKIQKGDTPKVFGGFLKGTF